MADDIMDVQESILKSIKQALGYDLDEAFDVDIMMHINTVFATLTDLGIGPDEGYIVRNDTQKWTDFYGEADATLGRAQTYVWAKVKLAFDPPGTPHHIKALEDIAKEAEWRLLSNRERNEWVAPSALDLAPSGLSLVDLYNQAKGES